MINEAILTRQAKVNLAKALAEADVASKEVRISELKDKIKLLEKKIGLELMVYFNRLIESNTSIDAHRLKFI